MTIKMTGKEESMNLLKICETYPGFDGEVNGLGQGTKTIFIRFQGCNLRCAYCDTRHAQSVQGGTNLPVSDVIKEVSKLREETGAAKVTITGGEPLLQQAGLVGLLEKLKLVGLRASLETNGSFVLFPIIQRLADSVIIDYKLKGSGMNAFMIPFAYYGVLGTRDAIKFVITTEEDFFQALKVQEAVMNFYKDFPSLPQFAYSPVHGQISPKNLADLLLQSKNPGLLNIQIHKYIWPDECRGV